MFVWQDQSPTESGGKQLRRRPDPPASVQRADRSRTRARLTVALAAHHRQHQHEKENINLGRTVQQMICNTCVSIKPTAVPASAHFAQTTLRCMAVSAAHFAHPLT